jgi:amino acid adenylation domain-containing protein
MIKPTCYIIGEESITIKCTEILVEQGFEVLGIISSKKIFRNWAEKHTVPFYETIDCLKELSQPYDYLFSIVNYQLLPKTILKMPKVFAINYHDSLLPKYAGIHATSWAIYNNEKWHGITWHLMEEQIDAGDILKQKKIKITPDETAFSLNLKCYEKAVSSFYELVTELKNGTFKVNKQKSYKRSYYARTKKLPGNGFLSWGCSSEEIYRLSRALDFGEYQNKLGLAKFIFDDELYIVKGLEQLDKTANKSTGTIIDASEKGLEVSTQTNNVLIKDICNLDGKSELSKFNKFKNNKNIRRLKLLKHQELQEIESICSDIAHYEDFWVNELACSIPVDFTLHSLEALSDKTNSSIKLIDSIDLSTDAYTKLSNHFNSSSVEVFLSLFFIYLYRFTSQEAMSVAYKDEKLEQYFVNSYGLIANSVPFNIQIRDEDCFQNVLKQVKNKLSQMAKHKSYARDVFARYPELINKNASFPVAIFFGDSISGNLKEDISLNIYSNAKKTHVKLYAKASLSEGLAETLLKNIACHLKTLLSSILNNANIAVSHLNMLSAEEYKKVVIDHNDIKPLYHLDKTVIELFERQVKLNSHHVALDFEGIQLSYEELNKRANRLAHYLCQNYRSNETVALYLDRSIEMVVAMLAVMKACCAYLPIALEHPIDRINYMIGDAKPLALLTKRKLLPNLSGLSQRKSSNTDLLCIDNLEFYEMLPSENLVRGPKLHDPIYIIYTSGSTGIPKGVINTHLGLCNRVLWMLQEFQLGSNDVFLQKTPYSFDISFWEIFTPLCSGAKLVISRPEGHKDPAYLAELIVKKNISVIHFVPSLLQVFLDVTNLPNNHLRLVVTSGEALSFKLKEQFLLQYPSIMLLNLYGPTEASIEVAYWVCLLAAKSELNRAVPIGKPIKNVSLYVLDKFMKPVPIGAKGELHIGGVAVANGYLNNTTLNNQRFIGNPFVEQVSSKLYKTGDIVRWLPNGDIEYFGRVDSQIKINGYRIELAEIESHIMAYRNIKECAALVIESKNQKKSIYAFLTLQNKNKFDIQLLKSFLNSKLPYYMIPGHFIILDSIPVNQNGKLDRHVLEKMVVSDQNPIVNVAKSDTEKFIAEIWSKALEIPAQDLDMKMNFFELGGDSISAIKAASLITKKFKIKFQISSIFECPSIESCAKLVQSLSKHKQVKKLKGATYNKIEVPAFQMRMLKPGMRINANNILIPLAWSGKLNKKKLLAAVDRLVEMHDALSFNLVWDKSIPIFIYKKKSRNKLIITHDISKSATTSADDQRICQHYLNTPIDLQEDSLFKIILIKNGQKKYTLILFFHHLIVDRDAINIITNSLFDLYHNNETSKYGDKVNQAPGFFEYVNSLNINEENIATQKNFWLESLLHKKRLLSFTSDNTQASYQEFLLSHFTFDEVKSCCVNYKVTPFIFFLAVLKKIIHELFSENQFAIGFVVSKRDDAFFENTVAPMANQSLIHTQFSHIDNFAILLAHLMQSLRLSYCNSDLSIKIIEEMLQEHEGETAQLFNVFFDYEEEKAIESSIEDIKITRLSVPSTNSMKRILSFRVLRKSNVLYFGVRYRTSLFSKQDIENLATKFQDTICYEISQHNTAINDSA